MELSSNDIFTAEGLKKEREEREKKKRENTIEWVTFYRRNWDIFAEHYLGVQLKPFQRTALHLMGVSDSYYMLCSRGSGKSFLTGLAAITVFMLYPYSEVVISASTEAQANKLVTTKIRGEFIDKLSPVLNYMYKKKYITTFTTETGASGLRNNLNGSTIVAVAPIDSSRGLRATCLILDEHRIMKPHDVHAILMPMQRPRQAKYFVDDSKYNNKRWTEEARTYYLTSTGYTFEPFWKTFKNHFVQHFNERTPIRYNLYACDIYTSIKYGIKSVGDFEKARQESDDATFRMEFLNETIGIMDDGYFDFNLFQRNQVVIDTFLEPTDEMILMGSPTDIPEKEPDEVRMIVVDFAFVQKGSSSENDNTIILCVQMRYVDKMFVRFLNFIDVHDASDSTGAVTRIRKLRQDFDADYVVFDSRAGGEVLYNLFTEPAECETRGNNWNGSGLTVANVNWHVVNDAKLADYRSRTVDPQADPCLIPFLGNSALNQTMWSSLKKHLETNSWRFPITMKTAQERLMETQDFYAMSAAEIAIVLNPYGQTDALIAEAVNLKAVIMNGNIQLREPRNMTKDRAVSLAYANLIFDSIENELRQHMVGDDDAWDTIDLVF